MIKAATLPLALILLLAAAPAALAQTPPQEAAVNEAVYRQANHIALRQRLADARAAQVRGALPSAAKLYDDAWDLVQKIGSGVDAEREQTVAGLAAVRLELARTAQGHGNYMEARTQVDDVLRVDPANAPAIAFKSGNEKLLAEQRGAIPSEDVLSRVPALIEDKVKASTLVRDGKLFYEMGKLDEADAKLKQALRQDPQNEAGLYYLNLVSQAKFTKAAKLHEVTMRQDIRAVEQAWANPVARDLLPVPNPYARSNNLVHTGSGRQAIISKLDRIRLDTVKYDGLPLSEVIINLSDESRKRDPDKRGINFLIPSPAITNAASEAAPDPWTGVPKPATPATPVDLFSLPITIKPPLTNVRLVDVLDAIVKVAGQPIKYSIEDHAIVFSARPSQESPPLYIRTFKVDSNTFYQGLQPAMGAAMTNRLEANWEVVSRAVIDYFARVGVDLDPKRSPGKSLFWSDRAGMLVVRATLHDLDIIEAMIQMLIVVPPQINIKCMFVEVSQDDAKALGFAWYLGNTLMTNGAVGYSIGTAPSFTGAPTAANPLGAFPGNPSPTERPSPTPPTLSGILRDPQFRMVTKALQQRNGTEILSQPEVTVTSGRQAQVKTVTIQRVVTGINERALTPPGITITNADESPLYVTESKDFGQSLDVIPSVLADGYTIALTVIPTMTEFLGYAEGQTNRVAVYVNGEKKWVTPPRPNIRQRQMSTSVQVWDGQTVVLGGLVSESVNTTSKKKSLLVFITPTLIDPAGNRLHPEKEMPPGRNGVPVQPPH